MVRVTECFECGAQENETKLIFNFNGPVLCEKCNKRFKTFGVRFEEKSDF